MNIFRFTGWEVFFKWSILKQIKPNNNFIILSFLSLSQIVLVANISFCLVSKWICGS